MSRIKCANCDKISEENKYKPFCSKRCADVDLNRWMKGSYVIPGNSLEVAENVPISTSSQDDEI